MQKLHKIFMQIKCMEKHYKQVTSFNLSFVVLSIRFCFRWKLLLITSFHCFCLYRVNMLTAYLQLPVVVVVLLWCCRRFSYSADRVQAQNVQAVY